MAGQQFQQFPGAEAPTPIGMATMAYQRKANEIQDAFQTQWKAITGKAKKIGDQRTRQMLDQLKGQAQQAAQGLTKKFNDQQGYIQQIQSLSDAGFLSNGEELMWKAVVGGDAARAMYPRGGKAGPSTVDQLADMDHEVGQIEKEMLNFEEGRAWELGGNRFFGWRGDVVRTYDPVSGKYTKSTAAENAYYSRLKKLHKNAVSLKQALLRGGPLGRNAAKLALRSDTHSSFGNKMRGYSTLSRPPEKQPTRQQLLAEYKRLGGSKTAEGVAFAEENLR